MLTSVENLLFSQFDSAIQAAVTSDTAYLWLLVCTKLRSLLWTVFLGFVKIK